MRSVLAIDWDRQELRYATLTGGSGQSRRIHCHSASWESAEAAGLEPGTLPAVIATLAELPLKAAKAIVLVRRQEVESFSITLPPATDDEIPALVEAHTIAHNAELGDDIVADYKLLGDDDTQVARWTAVVATRSETVARYHQQLTPAKIQLEQLLVRPFALAAFFRRLKPDDSTVLIGQFGDELDFVVLVRGEIWFWRTVRSQSTTSSEEYFAFLKSEIARTMAVAEQHLPTGGMPTEVSLICREVDTRPLGNAVREVSGLALSHLDADTTTDGFAGVEIEVDADDPPLFAPLIAALTDHADDRRPDIDLCHPRRPRPARSPHRTRILLGVAAIVGLLLGGLSIYDEVAQERERVGELRARLQELTDQAEQLAGTAGTVDGINAFVAGSVVWLDELRDLSTRFPPPGDAYVLDFAASPDRQGGATIRLRGRVRDPSIIADLDRNLRDAGREVLSRNFAEEAVSEEVEFPWQFESLISTRRQTYQMP